MSHNYMGRRRNAEGPVGRSEGYLKTRPTRDLSTAARPDSIQHVGARQAEKKKGTRSEPGASAGGQYTPLVPHATAVPATSCKS